MKKIFSKIYRVILTPIGRFLNKFIVKPILAPIGRFLNKFIVKPILAPIGKWIYKYIIKLILVPLCIYIYNNIIVSFFRGIKLAPQKLVSYVLLVPGLLFGLTMDIHSNALYKLPVTRIEPYPIYNYSGFLLFAIFILICINVFTAITFIKKNSFSRAIMIFVLSALVVGCGIFYLVIFMKYNESQSRNVFTGTILSSNIIVITTCLFSFVAAIFAFIFTNKNYVKVKE